jgi:exonuclease III
MRLVSWNCNQSLSRKLPRLLALAPDLAVIQECERNLEDLPDGATYLWVGNEQNPRKGLGVISFGPQISAEPLHRTIWSYFLPVSLSSPRMRLLAVWAYNHRASRFGAEHIGKPMDVFRELEEWFSGAATVVAGDFNNSVEWDRPGGPNNFAAVDDFLNKLGLRSVYHGETGESLGSESRDTYFHTKSKDNSFHIDYIYAPKATPIRSVSVGSFTEWRDASDHVPIVLDFESR